MGLFFKEKTSKDYLKEIAEAQKGEAKITKQNFDMEREAIAAMAKAEVEKERLRIEQHNKDLREDILQQLVSISFDPEHPSSIIKTLTALGSQIDMWMKKPGKYERHLEVARSKYDIGISVLSGTDPSNTMLPYFTQQYTKWNKKTRKKRVNNIVTWTLHILLLFIFWKAADNNYYEGPTMVILSLLAIAILFRLLYVFIKLGDSMSND